MRVVYKKLPYRRVPCVATIGVFDGIHRGHQFILRKVKAEAARLKAASLLITFDKSPRIILNKPFGGCLCDCEDKKNIVESLGIANIWFLKSRRNLFRLSGKEFIVYILKYFDIKKIIVGEDFRFGAGAQNNVNCLRGFAREHNFDFLVIKKMKNKGRVISSSLIRHLIKRSDFAGADVLLGRNYSLKGIVIKGRGIGRKLGFPTANVFTGAYVIPASGVYAAAAEFNKRKYLCVVNIGTNPTVTTAKKIIIEAHLLNFHGNILGKQIKVYFFQKIREEKRFSSLAALKEAIAKDVGYIERKFKKAEF
jgi:riboflavin kinase/FMN adenylyltransferase